MLIGVSWVWIRTVKSEWVSSRLFGCHFCMIVLLTVYNLSCCCPWATRSDIRLCQYVSFDMLLYQCHRLLCLLHFQTKEQIYDTWLHSTRCLWRFNKSSHLTEEWESLLYWFDWWENDPGLGSCRGRTSYSLTVESRVCESCCVCLICSDLFLGVFVWLLMPWQDR